MFEERTDPYCEGDRFSAYCGMRVSELGEDHAKAVMVVEDHHLNSLGVPHGGIYFSLADLAFGAAVNYIDRTMVTLDSSIEFIASARLGDVATAISRPVEMGRKILRHTVEVRNQNDKLLTIVHMTGHCK